MGAVRSDKEEMRESHNTHGLSSPLILASFVRAQRSQREALLRLRPVLHGPFGGQKLGMIGAPCFRNRAASDGQYLVLFGQCVSVC